MALHWILDGADLQHVICKWTSQQILVLQRESGQSRKGGRRIQGILSSFLMCCADWTYRVGWGQGWPCSCVYGRCWPLQGWENAMQRARAFQQNRGAFLAPCISRESRGLSLLQEGIMPRPPGCTHVLIVHTCPHVHCGPWSATWGPCIGTWGDIRAQTRSTAAFPSNFRQQAGLGRPQILFYFPQLDTMKIFKYSEEL